MVTGQNANSKSRLSSADLDLKYEVSPSSFESKSLHSVSPNSNDNLTKWVTPTLNALHPFSETIGLGVRLVSKIFRHVTELSVGFLHLSVVRPILTTRAPRRLMICASRDQLIDKMDRVRRFFRRLEGYSIHQHHTNHDNDEHDC